MKGCTYVLHVASPFIMKEPKDENTMIAPAVEGTKRVIAIAQRNAVKRMVLTSSTFAIIAGKRSGHYGPGDWSDTSANSGAYAKSKTLAERAAWKAIKGGAMELVVINPGAVFGPSVGAQADAQNVAMIKKMIQGKLPMIPDVGMGMIDVRDVAQLHVKAMTANGAADKRFIAATAEPVDMMIVAEVLRNAGYTKVPSRRAPNMLLKILGLFDPEAKAMMPFLGQRASFDNQATFEILNWKPTPIEISLKEMAAAKSLKLVFKKPKDFPAIMLDETKIRQVIVNFIDNAIYYTPNGGTITVLLEKTGSSISFKVIDSGIGVPKDEQHKLFVKFYRAPNAKKARPDGTGLGLFMAKKVIVAQGGALLFSSIEGKGSTFGFTFPLK